MMTLSAINTVQPNQVFWMLLVVGIFTGLSTIVFISILFSWTIKDTVDNVLKLLVFAFITGASVYSIGNLVLGTSPLSMASSKIAVSNWAVNVQTDGQTEIRFTTSSPAYAYLEYQTASGEIIPIFAQTSSEKVSDHVFTTRLPVTTEGILFVVADGKKYKIGL